MSAILYLKYAKRFIIRDTWMVNLISKEYALERIRFYSNIIGIEEPKNVYFDRMEYKKAHDNLGLLKEKDLKLDSILGQNFSRGRMIFIDVPNHISKKQLNQTIIHELLHTPLWEESHNSYFYDAIEQVKKGMRPVRRSAFKRTLTKVKGMFLNW